LKYNENYFIKTKVLQMKQKLSKESTKYTFFLFYEQRNGLCIEYFKLRVKYSHAKKKIHKNIKKK